MIDEGKKITTINHYLRDLRTFIYYCIAEEHIKEFKVKEVKGQEAQLKMFSDEELQILLEKPKRNATYVEFRTWMIVYWILGTANRASTVCNVKIEDINFRKKEIYLAHTKNKKAQTIPLSSELSKKVKWFIKSFNTDPKTGGYVSEYLFPKADGTQLNTNALHLAFKKYCNNRGIARSNIHGLRHNFALQYLNNNGQMFKLQKILGHSDLAMVRRYVRLSSDDVKQDYDRYSPLDTLTRNKSRTQTMRRNYFDDDE